MLKTHFEETKKEKDIVFPILMKGINYGGVYLISGVEGYNATGVILIPPQGSSRGIGMYSTHWDWRTLMPISGRLVLEQE